MIARAGSGWQTVLADLSLILFIVSAAVVSGQGPQAGAPRPSRQAEPLALYRAGPDAPPLAQWLGEQQADGRQQLTITAQYGPEGPDGALAQVTKLAHQAGSAGRKARIVIEPGPGGATASLAYDVPPARVARALQPQVATTPAEGTLP